MKTTKKKKSSFGECYDYHKKRKTPFHDWMANNIKNNIRIIDENECREAWNAAITASIRKVNKSDDFSIIQNLRKLKVTDI
jgi:hypothetical protein